MPQPLPTTITTLRDYMVFEQHVKNARARRGAEVPSEWYEGPTFYYSNPYNRLLDGEPLHVPAWTSKLDFELELAIVIGEGGTNIAAADAERHIAGLTVMNDWSARDVQRREMAVGLGPARGKDFAYSLGPHLVTLDEVEQWRVGSGRWNLSMSAHINGTRVGGGTAADMRWSFGELIEHASRDCPLLPGDVIGSGTVGTGCLLELGPGARPGPDGIPGSDGCDWLQRGDVVFLEIEGIGTLTTALV